MKAGLLDRSGVKAQAHTCNVALVSGNEVVKLDGRESWGGWIEANHV